MLRTLFKALSWLAFFRAVKKGPRAVAAYTARRQLRKAANRQIRKVK